MPSRDYAVLNVYQGMFFLFHRPASLLGIVLCPIGIVVRSAKGKNETVYSCCVPCFDGLIVQRVNRVVKYFIESF